MKRFIICAAAILISLAVNAQNLPGFTVNQQDATTGLRTLSTTRDLVRNGMMDRHPMQVGITAIQTGPSDWMLYLSVAYNELVSRAVGVGSLIMIRTESGEVIELKNSLPDATSRDWEGRWIEGTAQKAYANEALYMVTVEELRAISAGVLKIRVQIGGGYFDAEYKKDKMGVVIARHLEAVEGAQASKGGIREGF